MDHDHSGHGGEMGGHHMDHMHHDMEQMHHAAHNRGDHMDHHAHMVRDFRKRFWISLILSVPVLALSPMIQQFLGLTGAVRFPGDTYALLFFATVIFIFGGYPFLKGLVDELTSKAPGMMTLIALAISVAYFYSAAVVLGLSGRMFFWELVTLIDVMLLGHWVEMKSVMGASRALQELAKLLPSEAHKIMPDGSVSDVPLEEISAGDMVLVKPGERVPADGKISQGETSINEAMITGESYPVPKKMHNEVIGGSVNGEGSIKVQVQKTGKDSFLSQVVDLVRQTQGSKSKTQNLTDKAAVWLTLIALTSGAITLFVWLAWVHQDFNFALSRTVTVMVITCPHALGLAIPLVIAVSTAIGAANGLLIKNRSAFELARNIQAVVFDKTGTLTKGEFGVTDVFSADDSGDEEVLRYAAAVESNSEHPIAKGIVNAANDILNVQNFRAIPGKGAKGKVEGHDVMVVSPNYLEENKIDIPEKLQSVDRSDGNQTIVYVIIDNAIRGMVALSDIVRDESREAIAKLKSMGIEPMMITGDNQHTADWVAKELGITDYYAGVLPQNKAAKIKEIQSRGLIVAMTGDGINDAPALAQADVGIAIGAGTDVAAETADVILVKSNPMDVVSLIQLARSTYRKMIQNLAWATGYNAVTIPLAAGVLYSYGILLSPAVGAVLMSLSTIIVAINARLLKLGR
jgi:Cu2+-exporting ATPase